MRNKVFNNQEMLSALQSANSILLCTHVSPDGDAIGSMLATGLVLKALGKSVVMSCADPVPARYRFLAGAEQVVSPSTLQSMRFDLAFALDAGDIGRIGACAEAFRVAADTAQIDHHGTNPHYARHNEVDFEAAATACVARRLFRALNVPLDEKIAECLYAAVSSDTGNFCFRNTDEEAFELMAELMRVGLPLDALARKIHLIREPEHVALLRRALDSMRYFSDGRATAMRLTQEDYEACGARPEHSDKIVNYGIDLEGVMVACLADGREAGKTKFSLRAQPPCDVSKIASALGGGGHVLAAGCTLDLPMDEACATVEKLIARQLAELDQK